MKKFLEFVAEDIINKHGTDLSRIAVVFPNKRASLFLNEHLAKLAGRPIWSPAYITISDLFRRHSQLSIGDPIKLTCEMHKSFTECTGVDETLDHFFGWGQLLLADFDDIDKNMADASKVFANVKDLHELDDISYLDEEQVEALKRFFSNFTNAENTELKKRFMQLWCHLEDIYNNFRQRLKNQGIAYEGMMYREVAADESIDFNYDTYLFVGFNVVQKVEQQVFARLQKAGKARFYWDFDRYYMPDGNPTAQQNEAGHYISAYLKSFSNELDVSDAKIYDNFKSGKSITYINATTENIQARYVANWLKEHERYKDGKNTAIVMCDESLLPTVIHCIPDEAENINITTGYPLFQTAVASFVLQLIDMQANGYSPAKGTFRVSYVMQVLNHPYAQYVSEACPALAAKLKKEHTYNPSPAALAADENTAVLFRALGGKGELTQWLLDVLRLVAERCDKAPLAQESLFRMYTLCNRLNELTAAGDLDVDLTTMQKLVVQLVNATSIPFHGEPAEGVQVMGILETRNLDFDHVLILSCNEGNMPKGVNDSSFIPYSIRKAYGLTTVDNKVAVYAYYFYNLIQRAADVTIAYNSSTDGSSTGEMSRFMLQLMIEGGYRVRRVSLQTGLHLKSARIEEIPKDEKIMAALDAVKAVSPTAVNRYMRCPLQFYYNNVAGIKEPEDDELDEFDGRIFGNVFHASSEILYRQICRSGGEVTRESIAYALKHKETVERIVDEAFNEVVFKTKDTARRHEYNGLQLINREVIIRYVSRLLEIDGELAPFRIAGIEVPAYADMTIKTSLGERTIRIGGRIDRLDRVTDRATGTERMRVIDYKTGRAPSKAVKSVDDIFADSPDDGRHSDYYLQSMLYAMAVSRDGRLNPDRLPVSPALMFIQRTQQDDYDPTIIIGKEPVADIEEYADEFTDRLKATVSSMFEPEEPFRPTQDRALCARCPYRGMCGA